MNITGINPSALPSMSLEQRSQLPTTPCCYFAIDAYDQVQYIGRSVNPQQRWLQHHKYGDLFRMSGVRIAWLSVSSPELLPEVEKALIDWFRPPLNRVAALEPQTARVGVVVPKDLKERLKRVADEQQRTLSQMAAILIKEGLDRREEREAS